MTMHNIEKTLRIQGKDVIVSAGHPVRVACLEHVEREIDDYVDNHEVAPDTYKLEDVDDPGLERTCAVCGAEGHVVLLHVRGM